MTISPEREELNRLLLVTVGSGGNHHHRDDSASLPLNRGEPPSDGLSRGNQRTLKGACLEEETMVSPATLASPRISWGANIQT